MALTSYIFNEGCLDLPSTWRDETLNVFTFPDESGGNLVINRTLLPLGIDPEEYYQQVLNQFRKNLKKYRELAYEKISLAEAPAHLLEYQWQTPEGIMTQISLLQIRQNRLLTFTYTSTTPFTATQKETLLGILASFKPHEE